MPGYAYGPSENELVLNITSQLLHELSSQYPASSALAPTRRSENVLGYDVDVRELLGIVFQFKRPSAILTRTFPTQLPKPTATETPVRFKTNIDQWITLISGFGFGEAFYAIPPILDSGNLYEAIEQTVFVDVYGVLPQTSLLYTVPKGCSSTRDTPLVEGKIKGKSTYQVPPVFVHCFDDLRRGISSKWIGMEFFEPTHPDRSFDVEQPLHQQRRPSEDLNKLVQRLASISNRDSGRSYISDRVQNAIETLEEESDSAYKSDLIGSIQAVLADTHNSPPIERWERIFHHVNRPGPYDDDTVATACRNIEKLVEDPFKSLQNDLIANSDIPTSTQLLQRSKAEICMLGRK